ncbi:MAG: phytoene desaturase family protein [Candidatus Caenarcaniphilales bacterium]|jgi:phytoene desaturase|nr:phytoene desaturase family protein [Candidatus Caenarcaniphilales bacterium]
MQKSKSINIIGAGVSGLVAACYLSQAGFDVNVFEKNNSIGGRARVFEAQGFKFDMGPSWYWLPDVFEKTFADFNKEVKDFYLLNKLDPSYRAFFGDRTVDVPYGLERFYQLADELEKGSSHKLKNFFKEAELKYKIAVDEICTEPGLSPLEFVKLKYLKAFLSCDSLSSMRKHILTYISNDYLRQILEFPILFLGTEANSTWSLYSFMNHADSALGTWFPVGGIHQVPKAFMALAEELGVKIHINSPVDELKINDKQITLTVNNQKNNCDLVLASCDYHHFEQKILPEELRNYRSKNYWDEKVFSPAVLAIYLGLNKKLKNIVHHNIFFDHDYDLNAADIYENHRWPEKPFIYLSAPSKTDTSLAPDDSENIFISMPIATHLEDNDEIRKKYFDYLISRLEKIIGENIKENIVFSRIYCIKDFEQDYNSFGGNAFGLANTPLQTHFLRPSIKNKNDSRIYYCGHNTVPGPGLPTAILSGKLVAKQIIKEHA